MKRRNYSMTLRMGATAYDLTIVTSKREVINYNMSRMNKHEQNALRNSVVAYVRQYQAGQNKVIEHDLCS